MHEVHAPHAPAEHAPPPSAAPHGAAPAKDATASHKATEKKGASTHGAHHDDEQADFATHLLKALAPTAHAAPNVPLPPVPHSASQSASSASTHAKRAQGHAQASAKPASQTDEATSALADAAATHARATAFEDVKRSPSSDSSTRAVATFSAEPTVDLPRAADVPIPHTLPSWMPADAVMDDTARMAIFPHALNWTSEAGNGSLQMQVRNGEVTVRAQGELAASLRNSEGELRVALAQQGLELHESEASNTGTQEREQPQHQQQDQNQNQEQDEWT